MAQALRRIGGIHLAVVRSAEAITALQSAGAHYEAAITADPRNLQWRWDLANNLSDFGAAQMENSNGKLAEEAL